MDLRSREARGPVLQAVHAYMAANHGLVSHERAMELGATQRLIDRQLALGTWIAVHRGVYRGASAPKSREQVLLAACFAVGAHAVASHRSAAWLWGLLAAPPTRPEISVPSDRTPRVPGVRVIRSTDLLGSKAVERRGIAVTDVARTVLDVSGLVSAASTDLVIDRAIASKLVTVPHLVATLEQLGRRGRRGSGTLRRALDARGVSAPNRTPSALESAMARVIRLAGVASPVAEYDVAHGRYRFDFAWPDIRVAVEVDGWAGHSAFSDWQRNLGKGNWAAEHGWLVLRFDWDAVVKHPDETAAQLRRVLAGRSLTPEL